MPTPSPLDLLHGVYERLAARDAATLTHDQRQSVRYHLAEIHLRTAVPAGYPSHATRWVRNVVDLESFIAREGRWPRENNRRPAESLTPEEQRLATWVRGERRAAQALRRCSYQLLRLAAVPGYERDPLEVRWQHHFDTYRSFLEEKRRAPSARSADVDEKSIAAWAAKQRLLRRRGRLPAHRISELESLPIWTWGSAIKTR